LTLRAPVSRRAVPGTSLRPSVIGFRIPSPTAGSSVSESRQAALLANARTAGITEYDVGGGPAARRAERLVRTAFATFDPDLVVLVHRSAQDLAEEGAHDRAGAPEGDVETRLRRSLELSAERLHPQTIGLLVWHESSERAALPAELLSALGHLAAGGAFGGWIRSIPPGGNLPDGGDHDPSRADLYAGPLSPLDASLLPALEERATRGPLGFLADDPLGSGRLDGTRFAQSIVDRRPDARPLNVRELRREFDPVLRLGFLTEGRKRTLAQASLQFAIRWPWVSSAIVPLPSPERLDELVGAESASPLSEAELNRILSSGT
jgi:aryl-alcohol dehydrogenase-like predicted oxidoreductase